MIDPRHLPEFDPRYFPECEGRLFPLAPDPSDPNWRIKLEFLAVYYQINQLSAQLHTHRQAEPGSRSSDAEHDTRKRLEAAVLAKETLDAEHARSGIAASAQWQGSQVRSLTFCFPPPKRVTAILRMAVPPPTPEDAAAPFGS